MNKKLAILNFIDSLDLTITKEVDLYFQIVDIFNDDLFENLTVIDKRQCGNTTRQVDNYIQYLFNNGLILIKDHNTKTIQSTDKFNAMVDTVKLYQRVEKRLLEEHSKTNFIFDKKKLLIKLNRNEI